MCTKFDTYCGLSCKDCESMKISKCGGCITADGKPFFEAYCEVAACAHSKNKKFCGECENFPCEILKNYSFDPEHGDNGARIECIKKALEKDSDKAI